MGRLRINRLVRIITGQNGLNWLRNKISPNEYTNQCRFCAEGIETFWHLSTDCPVYRESRIDIFLDKDPSSGVWCINELIEFSYNNKIDEALRGIEQGLDDEWINDIDPEPD